MKTLSLDQYYHQAVSDLPDMRAKAIKGADMNVLNKLKQEKCHISSRAKDLTKIAEKCLRRIPEYSQPAKPAVQKETVQVVKLNAAIKKQNQIQVGLEDKQTIQSFLKETQTQQDIFDEDVLFLMECEAVENQFFHKIIDHKLKCDQLSMLLCRKLALPHQASRSLPVLLKQISSSTYLGFRKGNILYQDLLNNALGLRGECRIRSIEQMIAAGFDPKYFQNKDKWEQMIKLQYNVDNIDDATAEHYKMPIQPHQKNRRCFKSVYQQEKGLYSQPSQKIVLQQLADTNMGDTERSGPTIKTIVPTKTKHSNPNLYFLNRLVALDSVVHLRDDQVKDMQKSVLIEEVRRSVRLESRPKLRRTLVPEEKPVKLQPKRQLFKTNKLQLRPQTGVFKKPKTMRESLQTSQDTSTLVTCSDNFISCIREFGIPVFKAKDREPTTTQNFQTLRDSQIFELEEHSVKSDKVSTESLDSGRITKACIFKQKARGPMLHMKSAILNFNPLHTLS